MLDPISKSQDAENTQRKIWNNLQKQTSLLQGKGHTARLTAPIHLLTWEKTNQENIVKHYKTEQISPLIYKSLFKMCNFEPG